MANLTAKPWPVNIHWRQWRDPAAPDDTSRATPVLVLSKGLSRVVIGRDDAPNIIDALERLDAQNIA